MNPWWNKHRRWLLDDFFADFEEEFRQMEENMNRLMEEARRKAKQKPGEGGPYVYGFSMRVGPDGKPQIEEFGNVPGPGGVLPLEAGEREPLTDVIEGDKEVTVIAELPGIEKKDIKLESSEQSLTIDVDTEKRKYHKELTLPCEVDPKTTKATFKNGVLEVKLKRIKERPKKKGVKVKVD